jgi:hypothetical protein
VRRLWRTIYLMTLPGFERKVIVYLRGLQHAGSAAPAAAETELTAP